MILHNKHSRVSGTIMVFTGSLFLAYIIFGLSLGWGLYFGMVVILAAGLLLLVAGLCRLLGKSLLPSGRYIILKRLFNCGLILFTLLFITIEGFIVVSAATFDDKKADYLLIPGAAIVGDVPSLELLYRLDGALKYMKRYPDIKIVVTGGQGPGENIAEADYMKRYLTRHGIDETQIIVENKSTNTFENISFSRDLIREHDSRNNIKLALVTNDFHVFRSKLLAERLGFKAYGVPAKTPLYIIPNHYTREFFAVIKSMLFD